MAQEQREGTAPASELRLRAQAALPERPSAAESGCPAHIAPEDADKWPGCGLVNANVTREVRIAYREWLLPFTGSPDRGKPWVPTSSDPRPHLLPIDVLRVDGERPLDQDRSSGGDSKFGHLTASGLRLARGYPGPTGRGVPVWGTNLERLPGLCDVVKGSPRVRTSEDVRAAIRSKLQQEQAEGATLVFPQQLDGRSIVSAGAGELEMDAPLSRSTFSGLPCWVVLPNKGPRSEVVPTDLSGVIEGIRGEANAAFGGDIETVLLPGNVDMTRGSKDAVALQDLRGYIEALSVLRIGPTFPEIVAPAPAVSKDHVPLLAQWHLQSRRYQAWRTPYRVLPGLAMPQRGRRCMRVTADATAALAPGDVVMVDRTPRLVVAFTRPATGSGELLEGDGPTVTASAVCFSHPWPHDVKGARGWYFHQFARLVDPRKLMVRVRGGSAEAVVGEGGGDPRREVRAGEKLRLLCLGPAASSSAGGAVLLQSSSLAVGGAAKSGRSWHLAVGKLLLGDVDTPSLLLQTEAALGASSTAQQATALDLGNADETKRYPRPADLWPTSAVRFVDGSTDGTVVTQHGFRMAEPWEGSEGDGEQRCMVVSSGLQRLQGQVAVTHNSPVYATTEDQRDVLVSGSVVSAGIFLPVTVGGLDLRYGGKNGVGASGEASHEEGNGLGSSADSGVEGEINLPVTSSAVQVRVPHAGPTEAELPFYLHPYRQLPCNVSVTRGSRRVTTLCDMADVLMGVGVVRILVYRRLFLAEEDEDAQLPAITPTSFLLREPYPGTTKKNVPAFTLLNGPGTPHTADLAFGRLPGCAHVVHGSPYVSTTEDLTAFLGVGDALRIGTRQLLVVAQPPTPRSIRLTIPWPGRSDSCLAVSRMFRRIELDAQLDCREGDPECKTSADIRKQIAVGEVMVIVSKRAPEPGAQQHVSLATGMPLGPNEREFVAVTPFTEAEVTLAEAYTGPTERHMTAFRVIFGAGMGVLLPGHVTVQHGSRYVKTTEDVSGSIRAGEKLRIGLREFTAAEPITPSGFTVTMSYPGVSTAGLKVFNLGRTDRQISLEALAALKLRCRSIFCLAKVEQLERDTPSDLTRALTAGRTSQAVLAAVQSDQSPVPYVPTPEEYARGEYTADEATKRILGEEEADREDVEREWQAWFKGVNGEDAQTAAAEFTAGQALDGGAALNAGQRGGSNVAPTGTGTRTGSNRNDGQPTEQDAIQGASDRVREIYGKTSDES